MPTSPLEFVVVERFPPLFRAYRWTGGSVTGAPLPAVLAASRDYVNAGDWIIWNETGDWRVVPDMRLRTMYQLPSGEPIA